MIARRMYSAYAKHMALHPLVNHRHWSVRVIEVVSACAFLDRAIWALTNEILLIRTVWALAGSGVLYLLVRYCAWREWYRDVDDARRTKPDLGIEWHFRHVSTMQTYVLLCTTLWLYLGGSWSALWVFLAAHFFFVSVHSVIFFCHWRDPAAHAVNAYSKATWRH